jgi:hypothetical protein
MAAIIEGQESDGYLAIVVGRNMVIWEDMGGHDESERFVLDDLSGKRIMASNELIQALWWYNEGFRKKITESDIKKRVSLLSLV